MEHANVRKRMGSVILTAALVVSCLAIPTTAWANSDMTDQIPTTAQSTSGLVKGAATRAAMPSLEILGVASVEESGQFIDVNNYFNWDQPKYYLAASYINTDLSPYLANLATGLGTDTSKAVFNESRAGGGAGPNGSLEEVGGADSTDQAVWALQPQVVVGTGGGVTYPSYTTGVSYGFSDYQGLADTMKAIAVAAEDAVDSSNELRYGSATDIAQEYEEYVFGTMGAIQQAINSNQVEQKTVALVENYYYDTSSRTYVYDLMTTDESGGGDGTAAANRYLETTAISGLDGINLATNYADTQELVTAEELEANVDLIMVGGQQSSSNYADIIGALTADELLSKSYFVENNGSNGAMYGVVMNSVENAQNIGRILGCLYPEIMSQQSWMAYYYETFYHIDSYLLAEVMDNALDGIRCWNVSNPVDADEASDWEIGTNAYSEQLKSQVEQIISSGYAYYQSL